jgi:DNA-binding NarL/FixJ family response regulator
LTPQLREIHSTKSWGRSVSVWVIRLWFGYLQFFQVLVPFSVLIADDNPTVRRSLRSLIEVSTEGKICGEAENGAVAIEQAATLRPDVIILDLGMPVLNGLEAARQISVNLPHAALLMFTMHANEHLVKAAQKVGIRRVFSKSDGAEDLIEAITSLVAENSPPQKSIGPRSHLRSRTARPRSDSAHQQQDQQNHDD